MRLCYLLLLISALIVLSGCSPAPSDVYIDYQHRLANVLDSENINFVQPSPLTLYNAQKPTSTVSISVLELASLEHCALMNTVANNNNQLGKVRKPSEQLKYALYFIKHASLCIHHPATDNETVRTKLALALKEKHSNLDKYFEYMVFNERELAKMSRLSSQEVQLEDHKEGENRALEALQQLAQVYQSINQQHGDSIDPALITPSLEKLNKNHFVASLITSARKQITLNKQTTQWLNTLSVSKDICKPNENKQRAEFLSNIFQRFYLEQLQAYQSKLVVMLQRVSPLLAELWQTQSELSGKFNIESHDSYYQQLKQSAVEHVTWWQGFYKTCKIRP